MRRTLRQIQTYFENTGAVVRTAGFTRKARAAIYVWRLVMRILRQWARDRCPQQAAALAFQSALSLVPILAIAFALLRVVGSLEAESKLLVFLATRVLPDLGEATSYLRMFATKISIGAAGGLGLVFTLATSYSLFGSLEKIFNDVWRVTSRRSLVGKLLTFYALVTLLPVLAGVSLYWSGKYLDSGGWLSLGAPLAVQFMALFLMQKLLPSTYVRWRAAFIGAVVSGLLLEALKWAFLTFAKQMLLDSYSGVYGPLGLVPTVLMWIYASWLIVLFGAEISHAVQNLRALEAEERRSLGQEPLNPLVALQLLAAISAEHERGGAGLERTEIARRFGLSADVVSRIVERLKAHALLADVSGDKRGLIPTRASRLVPLTDVLQAFRTSDMDLADGPTASVFVTLIADLERSRKQRIDGLTVADVLPEA